MPNQEPQKPQCPKYLPPTQPAKASKNMDVHHQKMSHNMWLPVTFLASAIMAIRVSTQNNKQDSKKKLR